eukprot:2300974-Pyramimonas_sp.AAC.1
MPHAGHAQPLRPAQLLDVVSVGAGDAFECPCSFQTNDFDVAADVQQDSQHTLYHGPTVRSQG